VPYLTLQDAPYSLELGEQILFIVKAKNVIGWGSYSVTVSDADVVKTVPLVPFTKVTEGIMTDDS